MTTLTATPNAAEQAREAFRRLLSERPEFMDTQRNNIQDIIPFLEDEDGFPDWLNQYAGNTRALSVIWAQTAKQMQSNPEPQVIASTKEVKPVESKPVPPIREVKSVENRVAAPDREVKPVEPKVVAPVPEVKPIEPKPAPPIREIKSIEAKEVEAKQEVTPAPKAKKPAANPGIKKVAPIAPSEVIENPPMVIGKEIPPALLEEQVIQASRALAEQFAIVKHQELALRQAAQSIEEATEALAQARQRYAASTTAYTNSLEDLARLMASSLGNKASDFSKLMVKAVSSENTKGK